MPYFNSKYGTINKNCTPILLILSVKKYVFLIYVTEFGFGFRVSSSQVCSKVESSYLFPLYVIDFDFTFGFGFVMLASITFSCPS